MSEHWLWGVTAVAWAAAAVLMAIFIVGHFLWGWTTDHPTWWLALFALFVQIFAGTVARRTDP